MTKPATVPIPDDEYGNLDLKSCSPMVLRAMIRFYRKLETVKNAKIAQLEQRNAELVESETALIHAARSLLRGTGFEDYENLRKAVLAAESRRKRAEGRES